MANPGSSGRRRLACALVLLPVGVPALWPRHVHAQLLAKGGGIEFRIAFEDKDSPDHTGTSTVPTENPGIIVEMVQMLPASLGGEIRVLLLRRPWARCLAELETGQVDAIFSSSFKPERMKIGLYPMKNGQPDRALRIDTKSYKLYTRADAGLSWDGQRFTGPERPLELVAMRGYAIIDELRKLPGVSVSEVDRAEVAFRMLLAGRAHGFAQLSEAADHVLRKTPEFARAIVKLEPPLMSKDYFLQISHAFHKRHPKLSARIWQALGEIRHSEQERLVAKYLRLSSD